MLSYDRVLHISVSSFCCLFMFNFLEFCSHLIMDTTCWWNLFKSWGQRKMEWSLLELVVQLVQENRGICLLYMIYVNLVSVFLFGLSNFHIVCSFCEFHCSRSLAEKVASVIGCTVISMENYRTGVDDGNDLDSIDFELLVRNIEVGIFLH